MTPYLELLGGASVQLGPAQLHFSPERRYQLLSYLAYHGDWVSRERLAYLFWPDSPQETARRNLRKVIYKVRQLDWLAGLEIDDHGLRWLVPTDVAAFRGAIQTNDWQEALTLYSGLLLWGLDGSEGTEFAVWLALERERLGLIWRDALIQRATELEVRGQPLAAAALLHDLLTQDELDEDALKRYMIASFRGGAGGQALRAYHDFRTHLLAELELEPTSTSRNLAQAIEREDKEELKAFGLNSLASPIRPSLVEAVPASLPTSITSFIGRVSELSEMTSLLLQGDCRLLTLTGPGGVGKTRLAVRVAHQLTGHYQENVYFAALESLSNHDAIAASIAAALDVSLEGPDEPFKQVVHAIGQRQLLLVLDNFEHLMSGAPLIAELLTACGQLKLLITSRERLNISEEWLFVVAGMPVSTSTEMGLEPHQADAVKLFEDRAKRVQSGFRLSEQELPHILNICQLVDGLPLGIELAAVWVRLMPCEEIAREIRTNLDFLESSGRNISERQRSLRATFEHSWQLLTPLEQTVLRKLAVFRGGFRREAAKYVADAPLAILVSLVDKSLLRVTASGRYDRHPLINQYMQEKLAEHRQEQEEAEDKHGDYFYRLLAGFREQLNGAEQKRALEMIAEELENLTLALQTAVERRRFRAVQDESDVLTAFYQMTSRYREGADLFAGLMTQLADDGPEERSALGHVLTGRATFCYLLSAYQEAAKFAQSSLELLRPLRQPEAMIHPLTLLGASALQLGDYHKAKHYIEMSLSVARRLNHHSLATGLGNLAVIDDILGNYPQAKRHYQEAIQLAKQRKNQDELVFNLNNYGRFLLNLGETTAARELFEEALSIARAYGLNKQLPPILSDLGITFYELGDCDQAQDYARQAFDFASEYEHQEIQIEALTTLGRIAMTRMDHETAQAYFQDALKRAWGNKQLRMVLMILIAFAELQLAQQKSVLAANQLQLVCDHRAAEQVDRDRAKRLLNRVPVKTLAAAKRSNALSLETVVEELLRQAPPFP